MVRNDPRFSAGGYCQFMGVIELFLSDYYSNKVYLLQIVGYIHIFGQNFITFETLMKQIDLVLSKREEQKNRTNAKKTHLEQRNMYSIFLKILFSMKKRHMLPGITEAEISDISKEICKAEAHLNEVLLDRLSSCLLNFKNKKVSSKELLSFFVKEIYLPIDTRSKDLGEKFGGSIMDIFDIVECFTQIHPDLTMCAFFEEIENAEFENGFHEYVLLGSTIPVEGVLPYFLREHVKTKNLLLKVLTITYTCDEKVISFKEFFKLLNSLLPNRMENLEETRRVLEDSLTKDGFDEAIIYELKIRDKYKLTTEVQERKEHYRYTYMYYMCKTYCMDEYYSNKAQLDQIYEALSRFRAGLSSEKELLDSCIEELRRYLYGHCQNQRNQVRSLLQSEERDLLDYFIKSNPDLLLCIYLMELKEAKIRWPDQNGSGEDDSNQD